MQTMNKNPVSKDAPRMSKRQQRSTRAKVTAEELRSVLNYDSESGKFSWSVDRGRNAKTGNIAGRLNGRGYREIEVCGRAYNAHRLAWLYVTGSWPQWQIDHIDGARDNNAFSNLRDVPININKQNQRVARKDSSSGILGAHKTNNPNRWTSIIRFGGISISLGRFNSAEEAGMAYIEAKRKFHPGCTI
jgi:hypothetical protein